jgi:hypothetical protein
VREWTDEKQAHGVSYKLEGKERWKSCEESLVGEAPLAVQLKTRLKWVVMSVVEVKWCRLKVETE